MHEDLTEVQASEGESALHPPWQSWGTAMRYLIVRTAQSFPAAVLVWLAYARH